MHIFSCSGGWNLLRERVGKIRFGGGGGWYTPPLATMVRTVLTIQQTFFMVNMTVHNCSIKVGGYLTVILCSVREQKVGTSQITIYYHT